MPSKVEIPFVLFSRQANFLNPANEYLNHRFTN
uniref:Uncharacterized protein n=1 Tax=Rhizophora mucronata TaxID=61149 RepID=A0A2P2Q8V0_RHIMU